MKPHFIDYSKMHHFSHTDVAYITHDKRLREFYAYEPSVASVSEAVENRKKYPANRSLLLEVLKEQYQELDSPLPVEDSVILSENTFTITTAHQPTLLTGPLFHIYKIASVIRMAEDLNKKFPQQKFLPVFIVSGEDHDWEEVNHFHLFGKRYEWERNASGPCGRMSIDGLETVIQKVNELFDKSQYGNEIAEMLADCLAKAKNYGHFHRLLISKIFAGTNMIVIQLDDKRLKENFIPLFEKEIKERFSFEHVTASQAVLEKNGFKIQAHCRQVNLFYMTDDVRERIDLTAEGFIRIGSGIKYSMEELISELHSHPERFSPNVILRPLYQEFILPNIAYVGGGGELAYWLERKKQFESANVHYPMLVRRNSLLIIDGATKKQSEKLGIETKDFVNDLNVIVRSYLHKHSRTELDYNNELSMIRQAYGALAAKAEKMDPTLAKAILAEESKQIKVFDHLGSRLTRTEKQLQETQIKRIERIKEKLFPGGGLQERHENFLSFYSTEGNQWIKELIEYCDPFNEKFILLEPEV